LKLKVDVSREGDLLFLIDMGADISLLKREKLIDTTEFDPRRKVKVKCVDGSPTETHGVIETKVGLGSDSIPHNFQLVSKQVDIPCDGILGRDFFQRSKATICYATQTVTLDGKTYAMIDKGRSGRITAGIAGAKSLIHLPPRSESIVRVPVTPGSPSVGVISKCELQEGIFVAATLTQVVEGYAVTSILNTKEVEVVLPDPVVDLDELELIGSVDRDPPGVPPDRETEIAKLLRMDHLNPEEMKVLDQTCKEYQDIFTYRAIN
jgi:hypothetical protein